MNSAMFDYAEDIGNLYDDIDKKEMAVPDSSVGADEEQSLCEECLITYENISQEKDDVNYDDCFAEAKVMLAQNITKSPNLSYLPTVSHEDLLNVSFDNKPPVIDGLLYPGLTIIAGAPKVGKSFLMADIAYHVSSGKPFWNKSVRKGSVLYFALEDNFQRIQKRMSTMFGVVGCNDLYFAINCNKLGEGLECQIEEFIRIHPDTSLIIIDTLQKVKMSTGNSNCYADDYDNVSALKSIADKNGISIIVVHHTRKQKASDIFETISGTTGNFGAADCAMVLVKDERTDNEAKLYSVGRDQPEQLMILERDEEKLNWNLLEEKTEKWVTPIDPSIEKICKFFNENYQEWSGSPSEFIKVFSIDVPVNCITKLLNINVSVMKNDFNIDYECKRNHDGRLIHLYKSSLERDSGDGCVSCVGTAQAVTGVAADTEA